MLFVPDANMLVSDLLLTFALFTQLLTLPAGRPLPASEVREIEDSKPFAPSHREITIIELQSLVVFGCTALLFMVGATDSTHDREEGWDNFLFVYTE